MCTAKSKRVSRCRLMCTEQPQADPVLTAEEIQAEALQLVRKASGYPSPRAKQEAFEQASHEIDSATRVLLESPGRAEVKV